MKPLSMAMGVLLGLAASLQAQSPSTLEAEPATSTPGPQAATRSKLENFKDMVLATCIADAYPDDAGVAKDAGSSVSALDQWASYDLDRAADVIRTLVHGFLARQYTPDSAAGRSDGVRYDFLKCLDLYHSKALDRQARRLMIQPATGGGL